MNAVTTKAELVFTTSLWCLSFFWGKFYIISFSILTLYLEFTQLFSFSASFLWNLLSYGSYWNSIICLIVSCGDTKFYFDLLIGIIHFYIIRFTCSKYVYIAKARYILTMKFTYQVLKWKVVLWFMLRETVLMIVFAWTQSYDSKTETYNYLYYIQLA